MPQNDAANPLKPLKVVLVIYAIVSLVYGFGFLFTPGMLVSMAGGEPVDFAWLRWPGGVLIALGIGACWSSGCNGPSQSASLSYVIVVANTGTR